MLVEPACTGGDWLAAGLSPPPETAHQMSPPSSATPPAPPTAARMRVRGDSSELVSTTRCGLFLATAGATLGAGAGATRLRVAVATEAGAMRGGVCTATGRVGDRE